MKVLEIKNSQRVALSRIKTEKNQRISLIEKLIKQGFSPEEARNLTK